MKSEQLFFILDLSTKNMYQRKSQNNVGMSCQLVKNKDLPQKPIKRESQFQRN